MSAANLRTRLKCKQQPVPLKAASANKSKLIRFLSSYACELLQPVIEPNMVSRRAHLRLFALPLLKQSLGWAQARAFKPVGRDCLNRNTTIRKNTPGAEVVALKCIQSRKTRNVLNSGYIAVSTSLHLCMGHRCKLCVSRSGAP